jgi:hypothetical protein
LFLFAAGVLAWPFVDVTTFMGQHDAIHVCLVFFALLLSHVGSAYQDLLIQPAWNVVQDPVARYLSAYNMIRDKLCKRESDMCDVPSFSMFAASEMSQIDLPEECFFNFDVRLPPHSSIQCHAASARQMHFDCLCCMI